MKKPGLAVVGLGMASKPHLLALSDLVGQVSLRSVYNRPFEKAEAVGRDLGVAAYDSIDAIAADGTVEGVILIMPPDQRSEVIATLTAAGKHILTEKPVERSTAAALDLVELCEARGAKFGVVFQHRFRAGAKRLTSLIQSGELGKIVAVRATIPWWRDQSYYDVPGRGTYARDGGGVLISQAIHVLDLMLSLTGPTQSVQALCANTSLHDLEAEDFVAAGVNFASGAVGSIVATTAAFPGGAESLAIDGTLGSAILEAGHLRATWRDGRTEEEGELSGSGGGADPMAFPFEWHRDLIADFASAIRTDKEPAITGREGLQVHALIDSLVESSRSGQLTLVKDVRRT